MADERRAFTAWADALPDYTFGRATVYTLTPESQETRFKRELVCHIPALFVEPGDFLSSHNRLQAESAESLRRLKRMLEDGAVEGGDEAFSS